MLQFKLLFSHFKMTRINLNFPLFSRSLMNCVNSISQMNSASCEHSSLIPQEKKPPPPEEGQGEPEKRPPDDGKPEILKSKIIRLCSIINMLLKEFQHIHIFLFLCNSRQLKRIPITARELPINPQIQVASIPSIAITNVRIQHKSSWSSFAFSRS